MQIVRILAYRVELPLVEGSYKWSGGKEVCPLGPFYLPAYAAGARTGIAPKMDVLGPPVVEVR